MPDATLHERTISLFAFLAPLLTSSASVAQTQAPPNAGEQTQSSAPPVVPTDASPQPAAPSVAPAASAQPVAPAPAAPPAAPALPSLPTSPAAGTARVRFAVDHADAWLEARPFGVDEAWQRRCKAPCGEWLTVEGQEVRITAAGMTPSNAFRIEAGSGSALLKVNGGSALSRTLGRIGLIAGVPLSLVGMSGFAYGHFDERRGLETAGAVGLVAGAALVLTALPLLVAGSTSVRNEKGELIAADARATLF